MYAYLGSASSVVGQSRTRAEHFTCGATARKVLNRYNCCVVQLLDGYFVLGIISERLAT